MDTLIQTLVISILPVVLAITLHEAAHGYVALRFGDDTAERLGRISLNPLRHIDLWGTILMPLLLVFLTSGHFVFGYAKPVPVNFGRLHRPKKDMLWVALAGPMTNLLQALVCAGLMKGVLVSPVTAYTEAAVAMSQVGISVNLVLMVLNLLPLPPLDGGRIVVSLLPNRLAWRFAQVERFGFVILLALLFSGVLGTILSPLVDVAEAIIGNLFGLY